jgi:hypothetical protein
MGMSLLSDYLQQFPFFLSTHIEKGSLEIGHSKTDKSARGGGWIKLSPNQPTKTTVDRQFLFLRKSYS